ncbi:dihydrodipicolinate synthase family protein [Clostridium sp. AM58-1XD]|uniref:dihydrodipicolinate synthase family protein n=1 Tax=Clostridium sp. AM58-1XD TaxID=2292307 RepID=UPI000E47CEA5|nr:dihydrodipicolinate synthase family protein [Clostridium sp. AM58-1XD]RGY96668.1 dihydrodipicolinate synthase family protein [Clostridium sp. AM58-1XD]
MNIDFIKGVIVPIFTPINENEKIDEKKLRKQVEYVIEGGVHGILAYGSNGEFFGLEDDEIESGLKIIVDQTAGRIPVYMGIGSITTRKAVRLAKIGREAGAAGISVLQPMFIHPSDEELYDYFAEIAEAVPDFPVILYNNPGRTGYQIKASVVMKLCSSCTNIVGIKDSSGDMNMTAELIRQAKCYPFKVLGGKDTLILGAMVYGAAGCVATTANIFPELVVSIYDHCVSKNYEAARKEQEKLAPIRLAMDKASFPVGTKDLANIMGLNAGPPYKPNKSGTEEVLAAMRKAVEEAGLKMKNA